MPFGLLACPCLSSASQLVAEDTILLVKELDLRCKGAFLLGMSLKPCLKL